jgi:nucleoside-diphosphate-sugar epimerase
VNEPRKRVLITGVSGFTGKALKKALVAEGYDVAGLINEGLPGPGEWLADLTHADDSSAAINAIAPEYVVHLAAISFVAETDVAAMYAVNALGSLNLLESLSRLPRTPRCVILASSAHVYGDAGSDPIGELTLPAPVNHYGASKLAMEGIASTYMDRLPCIVTRPFNYTGPGQADHFVIPKIVEHFAARKPRIELGNIDVERDFLSVDTVTDIYTRLLRTPSAIGKIINICSGQAITLRRVIDALQSHTGHAIETVINPEFVRANDIRTLVGANQQLCELLNTQLEFDLNQVLQQMLQVAEQRIATDASDSA